MSDHLLLEEKPENKQSFCKYISYMFSIVLQLWTQNIIQNKKYSTLPTFLIANYK